MGADIALFPEMWNIGYQFFDASDPKSRDNWKAQAISAESDFIRHFRRLARELNIAIAITYLQQWEKAPRNSVSLIDRHGDIRLTYAKVHPCEFDREAALTPGDEFCVCTLDTENGNVPIGAMICFDREFPESARVLMLRGAEIILTPNACSLERHRLGQFRARAFENMVALAMANYPAPLCNGHSIAVDPIAFGENETSRDTILVEAGEGEGIHIADIDLTALREYRKREVWGNAYRKPRSYDKLISLEVRAPFVRSDSRR
jgi:predicted amidohydrolase